MYKTPKLLLILGLIFSMNELGFLICSRTLLRVIRSKVSLFEYSSNVQFSDLMNSIEERFVYA